MYISYRTRGFFEKAFKIPRWSISFFAKVFQTSIRVSTVYTWNIFYSSIYLLCRTNIDNETDAILSFVVPNFRAHRSAAGIPRWTNSSDGDVTVYRYHKSLLTVPIHRGRSHRALPCHSYRSRAAADVVVRFHVVRRRRVSHGSHSAARHRHRHRSSDVNRARRSSVVRLSSSGSAGPVGCSIFTLGSRSRTLGWHNDETAIGKRVGKPEFRRTAENLRTWQVRYFYVCLVYLMKKKIESCVKCLKKIRNPSYDVVGRKYNFFFLTGTISYFLRYRND